MSAENRISQDRTRFCTRRERAVQAVAVAFDGVIHNSPGPDAWAGEHAVEADHRTEEEVMEETPACDPLAPYLYEIIWRLIIDGPLIAGEIATMRPKRYYTLSAVGTANQLRSLVKRGWLARSEDGFYTVTERACQAVCW